MDTLDPIQKACVRFAALTNLGAGAFRNYRRKADGLEIFTKEEEKLVNHNAKRSAERSLDALRRGGKSVPNPAYVAFPEDYDIFDVIEIKPGANDLLPEFTYDLFSSQFDKRMAKSKTTSKSSKSRRQQRKADTSDSSEEESLAKSTTRVAFDLRKREKPIIDKVVNTEDAFSQTATIRHDDKLEDIRFDFGIKIRMDSSFNGYSGPPFNVCLNYVTRGAVKDGKSYDVCMLTLKSPTADGGDTLVQYPVIVSNSGRRVFFTLPSGNMDVLTLLDAAKNTFDEIGRLGGKSEAREMAVKVAKQSIKKFSQDTYVLMVELPPPIRVHTRLLQEEALLHLGENFASGEILHEKTQHSSKVLRAKIYSSADGVACILPVMNRQEDASDEEEVDAIDIIASRHRERWNANSEECPLASGMERLDLDTVASGEVLGCSKCYGYL